MRKLGHTGTDVRFQPPDTGQAHPVRDTHSAL